MKEDKKIKTTESLRKIFALIIWGALIIFVFVNRRELTLDKIVNYTPQNITLAILLMLFLFLLKSLSFFIYGGLLCAASGVIFSLPLAIAVNLLGTVIMCSVPYFIGGRLGSGLLERLFYKHPRLKLVKDIQDKNEFLVSFLVRIIGILPADIVSLYMGASRIPYNKYIYGTMLGMFPSIVSFSIMGMKADDVTSPAFIGSAVFEIVLIIASLIAIYIMKRRHDKKR